MQPTTRPINPSKKVLVTMRFVFVIGGPMKLIRPSIADMMTPPSRFVGAVHRLSKPNFVPVVRSCRGAARMHARWMRLFAYRSM
jgi:hypothetical protein